MTYDAPVIWLLDVDGVLNAVPAGSCNDAGWGMWVSFISDNGFKITYSPELIMNIQALIDDGLVDIHWLTTWCELANTMIAPQMGLPKLEVAITEWDRRKLPTWDHDARTRWWWKLIVAKRVAHDFPDRRILWTDDDIDMFMKAGVSEFKEEMGDRLLAITPVTDFGITADQMREIVKWVRA